jgi:hypothetical protein
LSVGVA